LDKLRNTPEILCKDRRLLSRESKTAPPGYKSKEHYSSLLGMLMMVMMMMIIIVIIAAIAICITHSVKYFQKMFS
jgi:hypothetical protein